MTNNKTMENIREKIALYNFKKENKKQKRRMRVYVALTALTLIAVSGYASRKALSRQ